MILACLCSDFWDMCMIVVFGIGRTNLKFSHVLLMFLTRPWILELRIKDWLHLIYSVNFWISWFVFPWLQKFGSICIPWYDHLYRSYTVPFHSSLLGLPNVTHEIHQHFFYAKMLQYKVGCCHQVPIPKVSSISSRCQRSGGAMGFYDTVRLGCFPKNATELWYIDIFTTCKNQCNQLVYMTHI